MEITPKRIIYHHSADRSQSPQFDKINAYHKERGFPISSMGFYVGYHFLIEPNGDIRQARELNEIGAHDAGENIDAIGVCIAGDFNIDFPNEAQTAASAKLVGEIRSQYPIPITNIEPHKLDDTTDCPGKRIIDNWLVKVYLSRQENDEIIQFFQIGKKYNFI